MAPRGRSLALAVSAAVALLLSAAGAALALGELSQKPGAAGCIGRLLAGCGEGRLLAKAEGVAVSPDGKNVYVAAEEFDAVLVFDRDPATGALAQKPGAAGCISKVGEGEGCTKGIGFGNVNDLVVSPDGRNLYTTSNDGVTIFDRGSDGSLRQKSGADACLSRFPDGGCRLGRALGGTDPVSISPDGRSVYVGNLHGFAILDRDQEGRLTQRPGAAGCVMQEGTEACLEARGTEFVRDVTVSPDGRSVYAVTFGSDSIAIFDRQADGSVSQKPGEAGCLRMVVAEGCGRGRRLEDGQAVAVSPDGRSVYIASTQDLDVAILDRGPDGALTQKPGLDGCVSSFSLATDCRQVRSLAPAGIVVSPDGGQVYVASRGPAGVAVLDRDAAGGLTQKPGAAGCIAEGSLEGCATGRGMLDPVDLAVSPDGRSIYAVSFREPGALAVLDRAVPPPPPPTPDTVAPGVSGFKVSPARFRVRSKRGSSFRFSLSEPASVRISIERVRPRRRVATLMFDGRPQGANRIRFRGRVKKRPLKYGAYRATIVATDAAGNSSAPRRTRFTVFPTDI